MCMRRCCGLWHQEAQLTIVCLERELPVAHDMIEVLANGAEIVRLR